MELGSTSFLKCLTEQLPPQYADFLQNVLQLAVQPTAVQPPPAASAVARYHDKLCKATTPDYSLDPNVLAEMPVLQCVLGLLTQAQQSGLSSHRKCQVSISALANEFSQQVMVLVCSQASA